MLHLTFGDIEGALVSGDGYFDTWVDESVIETDFGKLVIGQIEKGTVYSKYNIVIPVIGSISSERLSGGTKALLTLYSDNSIVFDLAAMGDNCFKLLARIAEIKDIYVCTDTYRELYENGYYGGIFVENSKNIVNDERALFNEWVKTL